MKDPIDLTNLRELTDGDKEVEAVLFDEFQNSAEDCLKKLTEACKEEDCDAWRSAAHAMKGISMNLGAEKLANICLKAQESKDASAEEKQTLLTAIKAEYSVVKAFLALV